MLPGFFNPFLVSVVIVIITVLSYLFFTLIIVTAIAFFEQHKEIDTVNDASELQNTGRKKHDHLSINHPFNA